MKSRWLKSTLVIIITLLLTAPPCWAKAKGYCFVIGYSYKLKKAYATPVFIVKVRNVSYSDTEYVADMKLINQMEGQFQDFLARNARENPSDFTIDTRGAYKNANRATESHKNEKAIYLKKNFEVIDLVNFAFKQ